MDINFQDTDMTIVSCCKSKISRSIAFFTQPIAYRKCFEQKSLLYWFQSIKYIVRHSKTVSSWLRLLMWLLRTNKSTILLCRTIYFWALEPLNFFFYFWSLPPQQLQKKVMARRTSASSSPECLVELLLIEKFIKRVSWTAEIFGSSTEWLDELLPAVRLSG